MAQQKGTGWQLQVYVSSTYHTIGKQSSASFNSDREEIDITTKDSDEEKETMPGLKSKKFTMDFDFDPASSYNHNYMYDLQENGTTKQWKLTSGVTGQQEYIFNAWVKSISQDMPNADKVTCSVELSITGAVTTATTA